MLTTTQTGFRVMVPAPVEAPRGADWAVRLISWVMALRVWRALEAIGRRRAARHLRELAQRWESIDPERARMLREAARFDVQEDAR